RRDELISLVRSARENRFILDTQLREKRRRSSEYERTRQQRESQIARIGSISAQIKNEYISIVNQQGHLNDFPDGLLRMNVYLEERANRCQQDPFCRSATPIYLNNQESIATSAKALEALLAREESLQEDLQTYPSNEAL